MPTVNPCLEALRRLFVISDIEAWCPALRSSTGIRSGLKRGMCAPSVTAAALGTKPDYLLKDFKTFGFLFESLVVRDLKVYHPPSAAGSPITATVTDWKPTPSYT